jgi:2-oxoisovalerate dehydrogenase E1 component
MARSIYEVDRERIACSEGLFHVGTAGHEASAALASCLISEDYLHCHYRNKALLLARGMPMRKFFDSLVSNADSHSDVVPLASAARAQQSQEHGGASCASGARC